MSRVLPRTPTGNMLVTATDKWDALAQGMKFFFDEVITASQYQHADSEDRKAKTAWWEEEVHAPYIMFDDGEVGSCGGWLMAMPTGLPNIFHVYKF